MDTFIIFAHAHQIFKKQPSVVVRYVSASSWFNVTADHNGENWILNSRFQLTFLHRDVKENRDASKKGSPS